MKKTVFGATLGVCFIGGVIALSGMGDGAPADSAVSAVPMGLAGFVLLPILFLGGFFALAGVVWVLTAPSRGLKALRGGHSQCWSGRCRPCLEESAAQKKAQAPRVDA